MNHREHPVMRFLRTFAVLAALAVAATTVAATTFGPLRAHAQGTGSPEAMQAADELFAILSKDLLSQLTNQVTGAIWPSIERDLRTSRSNIDSATLAELRAEFERL